MSEADIRAEARKRLKSKNDFKILLAVFAVVILILIAIWFLSSGWGSYFWPIWPILGMSIAAVFAGLDAYGVTRKFISEADVDAEVDKMTRKGGPTA
ncbi:MAG: 2TM domain-containing protein [Rhodoglobus sp.]